MKIDVMLPGLGEEGVDAVTVSQWLVEPGARLQEGDDLLEITTDKAAFTVPAPRRGTLAETRVTPGQQIKVGETICTFEVAAEGVA
ncbi:MAG: biotin/lipoyl-containing protein [Candidatus Hydrogenedentales bacterium]